MPRQGPMAATRYRFRTGTYRLELELKPGETVLKHPGDTKINRSDLDPQRHFVITVAKG